jgi:hypothetical protein
MGSEFDNEEGGHDDESKESEEALTTLPRDLPAPPRWHGRSVVLKEGTWVLIRADGPMPERTAEVVTDDPEIVRAVAMAAFRAVQKQFAGYSGLLPAVGSTPQAAKARNFYCMWRDA